MTYCCEVFPKIAKKFYWPYSKNNKGYNIPHIMTNSGNYIVNFCPSCGADIRGIVITKDEFDKLK